MLDRGTICFWMRADDTNRKGGLVSKDSLGFDGGGHVHIFTQHGRVYVRMQELWRDHTIRSHRLDDDTWYHVALSFGPDGMKLYIDGRLVDSDDYAGGLGVSAGGSGNTEPLVIGANSWLTQDGRDWPLTDHFEGAIDDLRIYNRSLSEGQFTDLAAGQPMRPSTGPGDNVVDSSGFGAAVNLVIDNTDPITWIEGGGLRIDTPVNILSIGAAGKLYDALTETGQMTLEAIFTPENVSQNWARIVTHSDRNDRNFTLAQNRDRYGFKLRTSRTGSGGGDTVTSDDVLTEQTLQHVIVTYDGEAIRVYRNGVLELTESQEGEFDNWNSGYRLSFANEVDRNKGWLGTLSRVAVYDRALSPFQVEDLFRGDPPGNYDDEEDLSYSVRWIEQP